MTTVDLTDEDLEVPVQRGEGVAKLDRAVRLAHAQMLDPQEARYLVGMYYQLQGERITLANQVRALGTSGKPSELHEYFASQFATLEGQMRLALSDFAEASPTGRWALAQVGIGPVITAGLLAHIDPTRAPTVSSVWRFAGVDPSINWIGRKQSEELVKEVELTEEGVAALCVAQGVNAESVWRMATTDIHGEHINLTRTSLARALSKRPYNADLKVLCWKIGDSFVKQKGREHCFYGHIYERRKVTEIERNLKGDFADQAAATLAAKRITEPKTRAAYEAGRLPDGRIDYRARRVAIKLFLSHFWQTYREEKGLDAPRPYAFDIMNHGHYIERPGPDPVFS